MSDLENPDLHPFEDEVPPATLAALNDKVNQIVTNGRATVGTLTGVVNTNKKRARSTLLLAVVAAVLAVVSVKASSDARTASRRVCAGQKADRVVLTKLVVLSYAPSGTSQLHLDKLPHYADLDPATKGWVDDLQKLISFGGSAGTAGDANHNNVPDNIDALLAQKVC